jgi:hypothetical protein
MQRQARGREKRNVVVCQLRGWRGANIPGRALLAGEACLEQRGPLLMTRPNTEQLTTKVPLRKAAQGSSRPYTAQTDHYPPVHAG